MTYKRISVYLMIFVFIVLLPMDEANTASSETIRAYQAYPAPMTKPYICFEPQGYQDENINQKQAVAAALGLYLGLNKATAPKNKRDFMNMLCI